MLVPIVGEVQVVGGGRPLGSHRVNLLHPGHDAKALAHLFHVDFGAAKKGWNFMEWINVFFVKDIAERSVFLL